MKKQVLTLTFLLLTIGIFAQTSSFGLSLNSYNKEGKDGFSINANVRVQFTNMFGWQTEVGHMRSLETITVIEEDETITFNGTETTTTIVEERDLASFVKTGLSIKFLEKGGFSAETIIGGGIYRQDRQIFGLLSGELFLSSRVSKNLVIGIPISFNFITWERDEFTSVGLSMRYHM